MLKQDFKEGEMKLSSALALAVKVLNKTMDVSKLSAEKGADPRTNNRDVVRAKILLECRAVDTDYSCAHTNALLLLLFQWRSPR